MLIIMLFAIRQIDSHQQDSGEKIEFFAFLCGRKAHIVTLYSEKL